MVWKISKISLAYNRGQLSVITPHSRRFYYLNENPIARLYNKLKCIYLRETNFTAKNALNIINKSGTDGKYKCPDCFESFYNQAIFNEHCTEVHGYPNDMDVQKYHETVNITKFKENNKANPIYLKYL